MTWPEERSYIACKSWHFRSNEFKWIDDTGEGEVRGKLPWRLNWRVLNEFRRFIDCMCPSWLISPMSLRGNKNMTRGRNTSADVKELMRLKITDKTYPWWEARRHDPLPVRGNWKWWDTERKFIHERISYSPIRGEPIIDNETTANSPNTEIRTEWCNILRRVN